MFAVDPAQALVQKGERRHVFSDTMPAVIQRSINEENLQFMQHRDVYCPEYFDFITALAVTNMVSVQLYSMPHFNCSLAYVCVCV